MSAATRATVKDLHRIDGQAELIAGRIVRYPFHSYRVGQIVEAILFGLYDYEQQTGLGTVYSSTLGYAVGVLPSGRESFCPDASYYIGPHPVNPMSFIEGPPTFAVEVRDETSMADAAKRADYFAAGTLVVWDVDPVNELVHVYRHTNPDQPTTYRRGQIAEAEPAVPGWRLGVEEMFGR